MEPSNSQNFGEIPKGTSEIPYGNNSENKTDDNKDITQQTKENSDSNKAEEGQADDIERKDFEEENKIMTGCTGAVIVEGDNLNATAPLSENLACANLSHGSSSDYRSQTDIPAEDSNTTIRNMIRPRRLTLGSDVESNNDVPSTSKTDLASNLINTSPPSTSSLKLEDFNPRSRNRSERNVERTRHTARDASEQCDLVNGVNRIHVASTISGGTSSLRNGFNLPTISSEHNQAATTSGTGRSSIYDNMSAEALIARAQQLSIAAMRASLPTRQYLDDTSEDECSSDELLCTCLSSQEEEDEFDDDSMEENRVWTRKRKMEPTLAGPPPAAKKYCMELRRKAAEAATVNRAKVSAPGPSTGVAAQGPPDIKLWLSRFQVWSNSEKIQALDALITHCSASQVRHVMKAIEPMFQRDFISLLPKELALTVLGYLRPKDLLRAAQTCKYWQFLADDNLLWKEQCRRIGITSYKKIPKSLSRCASPWKAAYMRQYLIENNWLHKPVDQPIVMRGHDDHVITCLQFYGNRILSGSDDTTLKVWSAVTGKCLRTLVGHSGGVWSSQMVGDLVISGSTDRTLRVWNAKTGQCLKILAGHTSTVRCMHLYQDRVVSGSRDATLRVWSIPEGKCLKVLIGHLAAVRCVQYDGKVVVSGAYDYFVKVWNPDTGECLHTLAGHTNRVYSLQFDGVHVVSGSLDTSIRVWDVESGQLKHTLIGHQSLTSGMELHSNILVSGNADSTVKVWDITTGHCLHTLSGPNKHQSAVTCLQSSNRFVITSSDDGTVKLWDVRTGEFIRNLVELSSGGSGGVVWRIRASATKLICAVGSRNGTEETKLLVLDFDVPGACRKCDE